jgi:hypothetical protein
MHGDANVRVIFGMKVRQFREQRGYALKELALRTGLSPSYLTEIEKGKKYPKAEKILQLAQALNVSFDQLVSLKLEPELNPLSVLLDSPLMQEFPFQLFGITPRDVIDLMTRAPAEASTLIKALGEVASSYDMRVEHFFYAALRSYQEAHQNYFEDLETAAEAFIAEQQWPVTPAVDYQRLRQVLTETYGYVVDETTLDDYPELRSFRSVWVDGRPPRLLLNGKLLPTQKAFVLGRELGYRCLGLQERAVTSSPAEVTSFAQVLNDFKASYFAGALLMHRELLVADLAAFWQRTCWSSTAFLALLQRYAVTPEMFLYRLSELMPKFFNLSQLHFLRFHNAAGDHTYHLTKHLNMSHLLMPHGIGLHEHYCRRWLSVRLLRDLAQRQQQGDHQAPIIGVQRSRFIGGEEEYLCLCLARPLMLTPMTNTSVTLGFRVDEQLQQTVRFWDDPAIPRDDINETCERCPLSEADCHDRAAAPHLYAHEHAAATRKAVLAQLMTSLRRA